MVTMPVKLACIVALLMLAGGCAKYALPGEPFLPQGEWEVVGGEHGLELQLQDGLINLSERGKDYVLQYRIVRQTPYILSISPLSDVDTEYDVRSRVDYLRLNDDAMLLSAGCLHGLLLIRHAAGLTQSPRSIAKGRWGFPDGEGGWLLIIDLDRKLLIGDGSRESFELSESGPGKMLLSTGEKNWEIAWLGKNILLVYMEQGLPPSGLVRLE